MYRQGDVLLVLAGSLDLSQAERLSGPRLVLAEGEATGHTHIMATDTAAGYLLDGRMVVVVEERTALEHAEHATIEVSPGVYWVTVQREYSPQAIQRVVD